MHVDAIMNLVKCREDAKRKPGFKKQSIGSINFERICYEALLFHGIIRMLVDRDFDLRGAEWDVVCEYFQLAQPSETDEKHWPALGMPFGLFKLVVISTELNRHDPLSKADVDLARSCLKRLYPWYDTIPLTEAFSTTYICRFIHINLHSKLQSVGFDTVLKYLV